MIRLASWLGIRANKLEVLNESDCVKITHKGWLKKKEWREINDILRVQGILLVGKWERSLLDEDVSFRIMF